ncbi:MAG: hypothetical protein JWN84_37 [Nocardioides sp.]|nr:hypothetical protein [Nocardioides sp.]
MNGRIIAGSALLLVVIVGGILLLVGSNEGGQPGRGSLGTPGSHDRAPALVSRG